MTFDAQVLNHFSTRIGTLGQDASVAQVMDSIEKGALQWPSDRLKACCVLVRRATRPQKFADVTFRYVEDANTDEFFVPYVWKLIYRHSTVHWLPNTVQLFNALPLTQL